MLDQTDPVGAKTPIFSRYSLVVQAVTPSKKAVLLIGSGLLFDDLPTDNSPQCMGMVARAGCSRQMTVEMFRVGRPQHHEEAPD